MNFSFIQNHKLIYQSFDFFDDLKKINVLLRIVFFKQTIIKILLFL